MWAVVGLFIGSFFMDKDKTINVIELKKTFRIKGGNLERLDHRSNVWKIAESKNNNHGYCIIYFNGRKVAYHRIMWMVCKNESIPKGYEIDHINGNRIDNRIENLRIVSRRENQQNRKEHRNGHILGQTYHKRTNTYVSQIQIGGTNIKIGYFKTPELAHRAYTVACDIVSKYTDNKSFRELVKSRL